MDNGSATALLLDSGWAAKSAISRQFKLLSTSVINDANGKQYTTKIVEAPIFNIGNFKLTNVPARIFAAKTPFGFEVNILGNDALKRFNMILDLQHDYIYLKENRLINAPYRDKAGS